MISEDYAIKVQGLCKTFKVYPSPKKMLKELLCGGKEHEDFHALRDISFEVKRGEVMGVMGRNGAGKSTLLRILAGTLNPTGGMIDVRGKVSAILELGTGFNPEYTGRENVVSGGLVLGMSKAEIAQKMDAIIDFSELEEFIDRPFKTYSSGMQARLTFATAISVNPDVLIVDEALAVGDARFQAKCYAHIEKFRDHGGSILFVSHADNAIARLCDSAMLLEKGSLLCLGSPAKVGKEYLAFVHADSTSSAPEDCLKKQGSCRVGSREFAEILRFEILDQEGLAPSQLKPNNEYFVQLTVKIKKDMNRWGFGCVIKDVRGVSLFGADTRAVPKSLPPVFAGQIVECRIQITCPLTNGTYFCSGGIANFLLDVPQQDYIDDALCMEISANPLLHTYSTVDMQHKFSVKTIAG